MLDKGIGRECVLEGGREKALEREREQENVYRVFFSIQVTFMTVSKILKNMAFRKEFKNLWQSSKIFLIIMHHITVLFRKKIVLWLLIHLRISSFRKKSIL